MKNTDVSDVRKHCPKCGRRWSALIDSIVVEYGEWDGNAYESEGDVDVYRCSDRTCAFEFADVTGIPEDLSARGETPSSAPPAGTQNHDKGLG